VKIGRTLSTTHTFPDFQFYNIITTMYNDWYCGWLALCVACFGMALSVSLRKKGSVMELTSIWVVVFIYTSMTAIVVYNKGPCLLQMVMGVGSIMSVIVACMLLFPDELETSRQGGT
jgi:hypothetical protein